MSLLVHNTYSHCKFAPVQSIFYKIHCCMFVFITAPKLLMCIHWVKLCPGSAMMFLINGGNANYLYLIVLWIDVSLNYIDEKRIRITTKRLSFYHCMRPHAVFTLTLPSIVSGSFNFISASLYGMEIPAHKYRLHSRLFSGPWITV